MSEQRVGNMSRASNTTTGEDRFCSDALGQEPHSESNAVEYLLDLHYIDLRDMMGASAAHAVLAAAHRIVERVRLAKKPMPAYADDKAAGLVALAIALAAPEKALGKAGDRDTWRDRWHLYAGKSLQKKQVVRLREAMWLNANPHDSDIPHDN